MSPQPLDFDLSMFRSFDIRTRADILSYRSSARLIHAEAKYFRDDLHTNHVVLFRDARLSAAGYQEQAADILCTLGFDVDIYLQPASACLFYFHCMRNPEAAGLLIGASHNPGDYIGQKIVGPGLTPIAMGCGPKNGLQAIRQNYMNGTSPAASPSRGRLRIVDPLAEYVGWTLDRAGIEQGDLSGLRIVMDFLCGTAGEEVLSGFSATGASILPRNLVPDGNFPCGEPNPVIDKSIAPTVQLMNAEDGPYDFAMAFDGDGDRLEILTRGGVSLSPSFNLSMIMRDVVGSFAGEVTGGAKAYADIKANPYALVKLAQEGFHVSVMKNGHSHIKQKLASNARHGYLCAVEESCHYFMNVFDNGALYSTENTLLFALLTAKCWRDNPEGYQACLDLQSRTFRQREWGYEFPSPERIEFAMSEVESVFRNRQFMIAKEADDGSSLDAVVMSDGLPSSIGRETKLSDDWVRISQRVSQNENNVARWEVTAGQPGKLHQAVDTIRSIAARHDGREM